MVDIERESQARTEPPATYNTAVETLPRLTVFVEEEESQGLPEQFLPAVRLSHLPARVDKPRPELGALEELTQLEVTELDVLIIEDRAADLVLIDVKTTMIILPAS